MTERKPKSRSGDQRYPIDTASSMRRFYAATPSTFSILRRRAMAPTPARPESNNQAAAGNGTAEAATPPAYKPPDVPIAYPLTIKSYKPLVNDGRLKLVPGGFSADPVGAPPLVANRLTLKPDMFRIDVAPTSTATFKTDPPAPGCESVKNQLSLNRPGDTVFVTVPLSPGFNVPRLKVLA
jgi:hypothetical protein